MFRLIKRPVSNDRRSFRKSSPRSRRLHIEALEHRHMLSADFGFAVGFGSTAHDTPENVATDAAGNIYTTGRFEGTVDFDPGAGTTDLTSAGGPDIFVTKLDSGGNFVWAKRMGGSGRDRGVDITVDAAGNVYTTGIFQGTADFDPGTGIVNLSSMGEYDNFVTKLDSNGGLLWARRMGGSGRDRGEGIDVDDAGNVYANGYFQGIANFGAFNLTSDGSYDVYVTKLDALGSFLWAKRIGGGGDDQVAGGIGVDSAGNVYTTGNFQYTVDFDPGEGMTYLTSGGAYDMFISKLDTGGEFVWAKRMGGTSVADASYGFCLTSDTAGNVYTTGFFQGTVDFDPGEGTANLTSAGNHDIFVSKLDGAGNFVWAKGMGGTGHDLGQGIKVDTAGNIYTTGYFRDTVDFDPGPETTNLISAGSYDIFVSKLDGAGNFVWAKRMGGTGPDVGQGIAVDTTGNVYTTGVFQGTADFDPGTGTMNLISAGGNDIFLLQLTQNQPPVATDDEYEVNEDGTLVVDAVSGVLQNDTDPNMDPLSVSQVVSGPSHGTLTWNPDGSFVYTPFADFSGTDNFTYEVSDGKGGLDTATVTIDVLSTQQQLDDVFADVEGLVDAGILNNGQGNSLTSKLDNAGKKFDKGKTNAGVNQLEAFINQLEAFINAGILDGEDCDDLIDQITRTIVSAG